MTPERLQQIEELYHSARERGAAVLADADPELRREVEKLLAEDTEGGGKLLDQSAADLLAGAPAPQITPGTQLGPYKIEARLGKGGMGQVFRAVDTRLGRTVAIKVSNERFSDRFEQESRAIAALNHPNICTLHDVGANYLVMELVEGETLAARLKRGKLTIEQAIRFGAQIAEGLAAAHAKGIIHRDLKPANVMLTKSGVKVLDFGLAKSMNAANLTASDAIVGTPAYMAPELFEGKAADSRTDIFSLGLVLAEMVTGKRTHPGQAGSLPPLLDRVVKRCLEHDPDERWQSARDLKWELEVSASAPAAATSGPWNGRLAGAVAAVALLLAALAWLYFRAPSPAREPVRMSVLLPEKSHPLSLAISADGRAIAVVLVKDGRQQIWIRALDSLEMTPLDGTDGAANPFWSPDSRSIGYFADGRLKRIDRSGGPVQTLCDSMGALGGTWNQNGEILFGDLVRLKKIPARGGAVSHLANEGVREIYPFFLPDGRHFLATQNPRPTEAGVWLRMLDGSDSRHILPDVSNAQFIGPLPGSNVGAVVFTRRDTLMALPFDVRRLEAAGDPFPVARGIAGGSESCWMAAASNQGTLAYVSGQQNGWQYVWRDRQGRKLGAFPNAGAVAMISPDGKRLLGDQPPGDNWVLDFARGVATRLTFEGAFNPVWSPDGRYVAYSKHGTGIFRKLANGAGQPELLVPAQNLAVPESWSPDGQFIVYGQINNETAADLLAVPVNGDRKPFIVVQTPATENQGQFSPDGHWLAYTSNESGQSEIYVIPFPPTAGGGKWLVSRGGGVQARWNRNGKELFYISNDSQMMSVEVNTRSVFQSGTPHPLFQTDIVDTGIRNGPISWDVAPDGNRFLIITPSSSDTPSLTVVLNWRAGTPK